MRKLDKFPIATSTGCAFHFAHKKQQAKTITYVAASPIASAVACHAGATVAPSPALAEP